VIDGGYLNMLFYSYPHLAYRYVIKPIWGVSLLTDLDFIAIWPNNSVIELFNEKRNNYEI